jgi:hypothetical protein
MARASSGLVFGTWKPVFLAFVAELTVSAGLVGCCRKLTPPPAPSEARQAEQPEPQPSPSALAKLDQAAEGSGPQFPETPMPEQEAPLSRPAPPAPLIDRHPLARFPDRLAIYFAVGNVLGPGRVVQVDGHRRILASVDLPHRPCALAFHRDALVAAVPGASNIARITSEGKVETVHVGSHLKQPIAVASEASTGDVLVGDNVRDVLILLSASGVAPRTIHEAQYGREDHSRSMQAMSLASASDGYFLFATSDPPGVFRLHPNRDGTPVPVLPECGGVAADPSSNRWASCQSQGVQVCEGRKTINTIPYPVFRRRYDGGQLAFGPDGTLIVVLRTEGFVEIAEVDFDRRVFRTLFSWEAGVIAGVAVGKKLPWPTSSGTGPEGSTP